MLEWLLLEIFNIFWDPRDGYQVKYLSGHPSFPASDDGYGRLIVRKKDRELRYYGSDDTGFVIPFELLAGCELNKETMDIEARVGSVSGMITFDTQRLSGFQRRRLVKRLPR